MTNAAADTTAESTAAESTAPPAASFAILETERPKKPQDMNAFLRAILAATGSSVRFLPEWLKLYTGPGKLLFEEYLNLRLWDPEFYPRSELKSFIGNWGMVKLWRAVNFIQESRALATHKLAAAAVLEAHGLSSPPLLGMHAAGAISGDKRTSTEKELEDFLIHTLSYPAFGKPLQGLQSLGSISLDSVDAETGLISCADGREVPAAALAKEIHDAYAKSGYIFQPRLVPHDDVRKVCGGRIATVRVVTIAMEDGPQVFRASWKIPAGSNGADNFWRTGNILAAIDLDTGTVTGAVSGAGLSMQEVEKHPDTGAALKGLKVPLWEEICKTALAAAAAFPDFGLIGFDIAATRDGPIVIEVNDTPDAPMVQIAQRKGMLGPQMTAFVETRQRAFAAWKAEQKKIMRREYGPGTKK